MLRGTRLWHYREGKRRTPPTITSSAMPDPSYGVAYSHSCTATGSTPITWTIASGALPTGLSINAGTGAITGTPTASGAFSWTVTATNSVGTADQAATATVTYLSKALSIGGADLVALYSLIGSSNPANDLSGNGRHGTIDGATPAGGAAVPFPEGGNAMLFDGINDYVSNAASAAAINQAAFSMLIWATKASASNVDSGFAQCYLDDSNRAVVAYDASAKLYSAQVRGGAASTVVPTVIPTQNAWYCYLLTCSNTATNLYINGTKYSASASGTLAGAFTTWDIGKRSNGKYLSGSIAYAALINRVISDAHAIILATP